MIEPFKRVILVGLLETGYRTPASVYVQAGWDGRRLSISGWARRPRAPDLDQAGQMQGTIAAMTRLSIPAEDRDELIKLWRRWHLNDMRSGCEHQRAASWGRDRAGEECSTCGYRHGTAWLREDVPDEALSALLAIFDRAGS